MNERIKQLAIECHNPYGNFDLNKFAELIVRECAELCLADYDADIILAHFGVEE